ncbi:MAG: hypothetical protein KAT56_08650 [Sedimentisphaerales bacterium]|nr:hypothetical protein [Sedimentisphaerales bacterium]
MNYIAIHNIPVNPIDLEKIEKIIREKDIIRSLYPPSLFNQYFLEDYLKEIHVHNSRFLALFDRNIFTDIVAVAKNSGNKISETQKVACALLAFFQMSDTLIEPCMAISEYIDSGHYDEAVDELSLFRTVDNLDPQILINLALGRINSIPIDSFNLIEKESVEKKYGSDFSRWKLHYGFVLKLVSIEVSGGTPSKKIETFLNWMHTDYIFSAAAIVFGIIYFSNKRIKNMVKNLNSNDVSIFRNGLRNAAWDMTLISHWTQKALNDSKKGVLYLFCTADKALKIIANLTVLSYKSKKDFEENPKSLFLNQFGKEKGAKVYNIYNSLVARCKDGSRKINKLKSTEALFSIINELEENLLKTRYDG